MAEFTTRIERTAVFGAPYSWTSQGIQNVMERFQREYQGPGEPPVVNYDGESHLFSMSTDEKLAINQFSKLLSGIILFSQRDTVDHTEEPVMIQLPGTSLTVEIGGVSDYSLSMNTLVDFVEDSDDSSDNSSASGISLAYWKPNCKEISILSNEMALSVSTITECYFYYEHDAQRVKIVGGNAQNALEKLKTMESMMEHLYRHRPGVGSNITQNFLSFTSEQPGKGVEFVSIDHPQHHDRIVVPPSLQDDLRKVLIGEERIYSQQSRWTIPENLVYKPPKWQLEDTEQPPTSKSKIWSNAPTLIIGKAENSKPRAQTKSADHNGSATVASKYLDPAGENRLRRWQQDIDSAADPTVPAEQPIEPELPSDGEEPATRRIVEDSDSDDASVVRPPMRKRTVVNSDDEDETPLPPTEQILQRGPRFSQQSTDIRQQRANRTTETYLPLRELSSRNQREIIQANSFYANIPRDSEAEGTESKMYKNDLSQQNRTTAATRPSHRAFGLDGSNDDDDDDEYTPRQPARPAPRIADTQIMSTDFDPGAYGLRQRHERAQRDGATNPASPSSVARSQMTPHRDQGQQNHSQSYPNHLSSVSTDPVPTWPGLVDSQGTERSNQSSRNRRTARARDELVQYDTGDGVQSKTALKPPPGLIVRDLALRNPGEEHLLDSPLEEIQRAPLRPMTEEDTYGVEETSFSTSSSSGATRSLRSTYTPQSRISRPNLSQMSSNVVRDLLASKTAEQRSRQISSPPSRPERIATEDELSGRKFYNTMNLQAPNRGKKSAKKGGAPNNNQISRAQQALREEFQPVIPQPTTTTSRRNQENVRSVEQRTTENPSQSALNAARSNPVLASLHKDALLNDAMKHLAFDFVKEFSPTLDAARTFPGRLEFEMQVGQLMILPSTRISPSKVYEQGSWATVFSSNRVTVKFTNILTNHGCDIDNILKGKKNGLPTWSDLPGPVRVMLEFTCRDNTGQHFKLLVKEDGSYIVTADPLVLSKIGIHCPGRVWDACAVLSGSATWQASKINLDGQIEAFISTLYVKVSTLATVYFRPPVKNSFAVSSVVFKRTSLHNCQIPGIEEIQLKITEVKSLTIRSHKDDKKLLVAFEKLEPNKDEGLADLHYEVAVIDEQLNRSLLANQNLPVGEILDSAIEISVSRAQVLLDTTLQLVDKLDWVGKLNYGNLVQMQDMQVKRDDMLNATLPPKTRLTTMMNPVNRSGQGLTTRSTVSTSTFGGPRTAFANATLPGVRAGMPARLYMDASGNKFYYGPGGAKIPYIEAGSTVSNSEILPGDSASQYGGPRRAPRAAFNDEKPPGFW